MKLVSAFLFLAVLASAGAARSAELSPAREIVLRDEFDTFPAGMFSKVLWARAEYHYLPECAPKGPWTVSCYSSPASSQRAWKIVDHDGKHALLQNYAATEKHTHPMLVAGDPAWRDYVLTVRFAPLKDPTRSGVVFRCRNDRCYYFFGVEHDQAVARLVQHETAFRKPLEKLLAKEPISWKPGEELTAEITADGARFQIALGGKPLFNFEDTTFAEGRIGLTADGPTRFDSVEVSMSPAEKQRVAGEIAAREAKEAELQSANPQPKLWKKISLGDYGVGRNLRFGDLDHDGQIDVLVGQMEHHGPKDRFSELSCLTAVTFDGKILWQIGEADPWKDHLTNDVAFQIQDLDGDGKNEVIYAMQQELIVCDGATGKTLRQAPTPQVIPDPKNPSKYPRILGDSLFFADFRGSGRADHLVLKDRYTSFWVLSPKLETIWYGNCQTGHYPFARDVDGDGRDELFIGYSMFDPNGKKVWSLDSQIKDHADAVAVVDLHPEAPRQPKVLCGASDEGFYMADVQGNLLKRHRIGHVQNLTVANLRDDLPGLEILTSNYWGNQGILHFMNAEAEIYHDCEPVNHGSMIMPVSWTGGTEELFVLSPNVERGGLYDGHGRRAVKLPADGHPDMCYTVLDVTGDARDELVVWDPFELWVYTQADSPRADKVYRPRRNAQFNASNYGATVSLPGWSGETAK